MSFRSRTIQISAVAHDACKAFAAAHGLSCPDEAADMLLRERAESDPMMQWTSQEYDKAISALRKATQERINARKQL